MVHLMSVTGIFHGRVVAARLGSDGILTELRGDVGGTYPLGGEIQVFVEADQAEAARHLLLADEAAAALDADLSPTVGRRWLRWPHRAPAGDRTKRGRHSMWLYVAWALVAVLIALYLMAAFG